MHEQVAKALANAQTQNDRVSLDQFELSDASPDVLSTIASFEADQDLAVRERKRLEIAPLARETFQTDGTADNTETFNLSHNLIDSQATSEPVATFIDDGTAVSEVQPDAVDTANNSVDVTDAGTGNTLVVFYAAGDQARCVVRATGPNGTRKDLLELDVGLVHRRDKFDNPIRFNFERQLEGVVPDNFSIQLLVSSPYTASFRYDGSETVRAPNGLFSVAVRRSEDKIENLGRAVRHDIAES